MIFPIFQAFTVRSTGGYLITLETEVGVSLPFIAPPPPEIRILRFKAIWDTGATNTVITRKVITSLGIPPIGVARVDTAAGTINTNQYLVNIMLPNNVGVQNVLVTEGSITDNQDLLIGMDIINLGDFSITNQNNTTVMSFRIPSCHEIDYVKEADHINTPPISRKERREQDRMRRKEH